VRFIRPSALIEDEPATTVAISDAAGEIAAIEADAYGAPLAIGEVPGRFTGKPYDADLGAYVFPFRNYRPEEGRWMSADPSGFPDGVNGRHYASNPLTGIDRLGLTFSYPVDLVESQSYIYYLSSGKSTTNVDFNFSGSVSYSNTPTAQTGVYPFIFLVGIVDSGTIYKSEDNVVLAQNTTSNSLSFSGTVTKAFKIGTYTVAAILYNAVNGAPAGQSLKGASYSFEVRE
jgi:RHS repeat-associated protein